MPKKVVLGSTANKNNLLYCYYQVWQIFLFDKMPKGATMFTKFFESNISPLNNAPKEGDLYKIVTTFGKTFELKYGFYDERDRQSPLCEPAIIYPDFLKEPLYTDEGEPFVTMMQDACVSYNGGAKRTSDTACAECKYFEQGEEWFGICKCPKKRKLYGNI